MGEDVVVKVRLKSYKSQLTALWIVHKAVQKKKIRKGCWSRKNVCGAAGRTWTDDEWRNLHFPRL